MDYRVYLVEDDENLNSVLKSYLEKEGFKVSSFLNGTDAVEKIQDKPDIWILDIMLPDINGFEIIKKIKLYDENTPVIFISARDEDIDRILGLEMGSDDYISKPFLPRELVIRVSKLLKRAYLSSSSLDVKIIGDYNIDRNKRLVSEKGEIIDLTSKEFDLLIMFLNNNKKAFSREDILNHIWGDDYFGSDRVVDDLVRRLRKKMIKLNVETVYGYGYRINEG